MKELTTAEEQVMQVLWSIDKGFVKDILQHFPDPKPAYNTVSTIVRILEKKQIVSHEAFGKTHRYFPLVSKNEYSKQHLSGFVKNYFENSYKKLVSFFAKGKTLNLEEMEALRDLLDDEIKKQKNA